MVRKKVETYNKIAFDDPKSNVSESFRTLRTNIQFSNIDKEVGSIVVTSANQDEGMSTVSVNLAITMANANQKVLLIDGDLRKPTVDRYFDINTDFGLTNILLDKDIESREFQLIPKIPNLKIVPSGPIPPNPSELLSSRRMAEFLEEMKAKYDIVLIDAPPIGMVTDAAILSTLVDGTLLVCRQNSTKMDALKRAAEDLKKVGANILGIVLNGINGKHKEQYYYYE